MLQPTTRIAAFTYVILIALTTTSPLTARTQSRDETTIRQILSNQTKAWNSGNIEAFMKGYWQSDSLCFIGKNGPRYGYRNTLENYKKSYPDTASMGQLQFDLLQLRRLSPQYYFVMGKWSLKRTVGDLQGYFTLLFERIKNSWVIISDHSS